MISEWSREGGEADGGTPKYGLYPNEIGCIRVEDGRSLVPDEGECEGLWLFRTDRLIKRFL